MGLVRYLLDTCTFLWNAQQPALVSASAAEVLNDPANDLFVSDVSVWKVVLKHTKGKLDLPDKPRVWIPQKFTHHQLLRLPLSHDTLFRCGELPRVHNDPFDRLLAAQAIEEGMTLLLPDEPLSLLGAARIW